MKLLNLAFIGILLSNAPAFAQSIDLETLNDITSAIANTKEAKVFTESFEFTEIQVSQVKNNGVSTKTIIGSADMPEFPFTPSCGTVSLIITRTVDYRNEKLYEAKFDTSNVDSDEACQSVLKKMLDLNEE